jgi:hypothetical protein
MSGRTIAAIAIAATSNSNPTRDRHRTQHAPHRRPLARRRSGHTAFGSHVKDPRAQVAITGTRDRNTSFPRFPDR